MYCEIIILNARLILALKHEQPSGSLRWAVLFCLLNEKRATAYSPGCYTSTIGAGGLNFSVRDGKRWAPPPKPPQGL
jgi:hypothetical protein